MPAKLPIRLKAGGKIMKNSEIIKEILKIVITETCDEHIDAIRWLCSELDTAEILENKEKQQCRCAGVR